MSLQVVEELVQYVIAIPEVVRVIPILSLDQGTVTIVVRTGICLLARMVRLITRCFLCEVATSDTDQDLRIMSRGSAG